MRVLATFFAVVALAGCKRAPVSSLESITPDDYKGTKLFAAWAANLPHDPAGMRAEVRADVAHMQEIFRQKWGGSYKSDALVRGGAATRDAVLGLVGDAKTRYALDDLSMYVQYSAGHGHPDGVFPDGARLEEGLTTDAVLNDLPSGTLVRYDELRDRILALPSKEVVVFMMACHSGGLIDAFREKQDVLDRWKSEGRTLFIMTSSQREALSFTGPGTDPAEPMDLPGFAGSRFGYHLWQGLSGKADGEGGAAKDGKLTLAEIRDYVVRMVRTDSPKAARIVREGGRWKETEETVEQIPQVFGFNYESVHMVGLPDAKPEGPRDPGGTWAKARAKHQEAMAAIAAEEKPIQARIEAEQARLEDLRTRQQSTVEASPELKERLASIEKRSEEQLQAIIAANGELNTLREKGCPIEELAPSVGGGAFAFEAEKVKACTDEDRARVKELGAKIAAAHDALERLNGDAVAVYAEADGDASSEMTAISDRISQEYERLRPLFEKKTKLMDELVTVAIAVLEARVES